MESTMGVVSPPLYIMAGGRSSRFGSDKARAEYRGQPLLRHVADALAPCASALYVIAREAGQYEDLGFATLADEQSDLGPMGGLYTALRHHAMKWPKGTAPEGLHPDGWCAIASCDVLGWRSEWLSRLHREALSQKQAQAVAYGPSPWDPLFALYHVALLPELERRIHAKTRSLWRMLSAIPSIALPHPEGWQQATSINTKEALETLLESREQW